MKNDFRITVIIPTHNRPGVLERCLQALSGCEGAEFAEIEVIVVDDGSPSDAPRQVLERLASELPFRLVALHQENAGQALARNKAMAIAQGRIWLFINDDTIAAPGLLAAHLGAHERYAQEKAGVLGRMTLAPDIPWNAPRSLHLDHVWSQIEGRRRLEWYHFWTTNISVKASFLRRHGIEFDPAMRYFHEDGELGQRLDEHGLELYYEPEALGYHDHAIEEGGFLRMAEHQATGLDYWARKRPDRTADLARFGYVPAKAAWERRIKYPLLGLAFNRLTSPIWCRLSRALWRPLPSVSRFLLSQCYAARKRRFLARLRRHRS